MTYQIKPLGLVSTNMGTKKFFFEILEPKKGSKGAPIVKNVKLMSKLPQVFSTGVLLCYTGVFYTYISTHITKIQHVHHRVGKDN